MKIKKRPLTLVEVLIAISLSSLIMTALFYFYEKAARLDIAIQKLEQKVLSMRMLESQLMRILPRSVSMDEAGYKDFVFLTGQSDQIGKSGTPYLLFSYDRDVDIDPLFANIVIGRLFIDKKSRLILATFPAPTRWPENKSPPPMKKMVLMENVDNIAFSFYEPPPSKPKSDRKSLRGVIIQDPEPGFTKEWKNEYAGLPAIMKMEIESQGETRKLAFNLPYSKKYITYKGK